MIWRAGNPRHHPEAVGWLGCSLCLSGRFKLFGYLLHRGGKRRHNSVSTMPLVQVQLSTSSQLPRAHVSIHLRQVMPRLQFGKQFGKINDHFFNSQPS